MIRDVEKRNKNYNAYVEQVTPKASCLKNCIKAFITGGAICLFGQILIELFKNAGMAKDEASLWTTICLVLASSILTGLNILSQVLQHCLQILLSVREVSFR